jgi:hypothetical protein
MNDPVFIAMPHGIEAMVCTEIAARQAKGIAKYGTTVADNPLSLRQWLQHAFEETLDKAIYLKRAIAEIDAQELRDLDDMCRAGRLPESIGTCGNVGEGGA